MKNMNSSAKLAFYNARNRKGDLQKVADSTGYSKAHVCNILAGRRAANMDISNALYEVARHRTKNSKLVKAV